MCHSHTVGAAERAGRRGRQGALRAPRAAQGDGALRVRRCVPHHHTHTHTACGGIGFQRRRAFRTLVNETREGMAGTWQPHKWHRRAPGIWQACGRLPAPGVRVAMESTFNLASPPGLAAPAWRGTPGMRLRVGWLCASAMSDVSACLPIVPACRSLAGMDAPISSRHGADQPVLCRATGPAEGAARTSAGRCA